MGEERPPISCRSASKEDREFYKVEKKMRIVIVGAGKAGEALIENLSKENHDIVVIDQNSNLVEKLVDSYDIIGTVGNGAAYDVQMNAGIKGSDMIIAVTNADEVNILCCILAKRLGVEYTIARVRNPEYSTQMEFMRDQIGINMIINPEFEAANDMFRMLQFPVAANIETFAKGRVNLVEIRVSQESDLQGLPLMELQKKKGLHILICAVVRDEELFIPRGDFVLQAEDRLFVTGTTKQVMKMIKYQGLSQKRMKDVLMIGGGRISYYLAQKLLKHNINVKIIELDKERCKELSKKLPKASIINSDGTLQDVLDGERISYFDACVSLTGIDEENIIVSMHAASKGVAKTITKISRRNLLAILERVGLESCVIPKDIMATRIVRYVRAKQNSQGSNVETLYRILENRVEALEFNVCANFSQLGVTLEEMPIKKNILIAYILRGNELIYPRGMDTIREKDRVIVVTTQKYLRDLNDILEG